MTRTAIVTGASRGIGSVIALTLAEAGYNVVVNYLDHPDEAEAVVCRIEQAGGRATKCWADVSNANQVLKMVSKATHYFGSVDILVNNAAIHKDGVVWKMDIKDWSEVIDTDLTGVFNCTKHVVESMRSRGWGRVINIVSVVGQAGEFGLCNYAAAKAGVIGFTKAVAREVAAHGVTVNALALGYFDTGMGVRMPEDVRADILKRIPAGRWGNAEEVGKAVTFLASDDAAYITGQVIGINGGYYM